jgi:hypothetical protein
MALALLDRASRSECDEAGRAGDPCAARLNVAVVGGGRWHTRWSKPLALRQPQETSGIRNRCERRWRGGGPTGGWVLDNRPASQLARVSRGSRGGAQKSHCPSVNSLDPAITILVFRYLLAASEKFLLENSSWE